MADQGGKITKGAKPWQSVSGAFFPWQDISITPKSFISVLSLVSYSVAHFIVSIKVDLFATQQIGGTWMLTVRTGPAKALIGGYGLIATYTLIITIWLWQKSTGLKWDPVSIADHLALFADSNALRYFAPLELRYKTSAKKLMPAAQRFRIGYWRRRKLNSPEMETVYCIGVDWTNKGKTFLLLQAQ